MFGPWPTLAAPCSAQPFRPAVTVAAIAAACPLTGLAIVPFAVVDLLLPERIRRCVA